MNKLLTISIPTYNRSELLKKCLLSISEAMKQITIEERKLISIYISDNSDNSETFDMLNENEKLFSGLDINYDKNESNIGSDRNIAKCFYTPISKYLFLIGDDDVISPIFFRVFLNEIVKNEFDLYFVNYFGLTSDEKLTDRKIKKKSKILSGSNEIILNRHIYLTFISSVIYRRNIFTKDIVVSGIGTSLVQTNLLFSIISNKPNIKTLLIRENMVGVLRNNTGGYNPIDVFLITYFRLLDNFSLSNDKIFRDALLRKILRVFYIRSFAKYYFSNNINISEKDIYNLKIYFHSIWDYRVFYRPFLTRINGFKYIILNIFSILWNIKYEPKRFYDYLYHLKRYLKF